MPSLPNHRKPDQLPIAHGLRHSKDHSIKRNVREGYGHFLSLKNIIMQHSQKAVAECRKIRIGAKNTLDSAGHATPIQWHFSRPKSIGFGLDGGSGNTPRMAESMFLTSSPPTDRKKSVSGYQSHSGVETMKPTTQGTTAQTTPTTPGKSTTDLNRYQAVHEGIAACQWLVINSKPQKALGKLKSACRHLTQIVAANQAGGADHE